MTEHAGRAYRPCRSAAEAPAGTPSRAGERSDQEIRSEHAGRAYRPCGSAAEAPAGTPSRAGERSDEEMQ